MDLHPIKAYLFKKLDQSVSGKVPFIKPFQNSSTLAKTLKKQIKLTVNNESSTTLICGQQGSGKTFLVNYCLQQVKESCYNESGTHEFVSSQNSNQIPLIIKLDCRIQTDDRLSVIEIASQIGISSGLENEDTIESDDPENDSQDHQHQPLRTTKASLDQELHQAKIYEAMCCVLNALKEKSKYQTKVTKRIIIIIENFEKLAARKMQVLLYNLLDLARDGQVALCLVGLTCFTDIDSLLEKRVKSRFANRETLSLNNGLKNWATLEPVLSEILKIDLENGEELEILKFLKKQRSWSERNNQTENFNSSLASLKKAATFWNADIEQKFLKNKKVKTFFERFLDQANYIGSILSLLKISILSLDDNFYKSNLNSTCNVLNENAILSGSIVDNFPSLAGLIVDQGNPSSNICKVLCGVSSLQFIAGVATLRVSERNPDKGINFSMVYREIQECKLTYGCSRKLHMKAFQELIDQGLIVSLKGPKTGIATAAPDTSSGMFEYVKYHSFIDRGDIDQAVKHLAKELPADIINKALSGNRALF